MRQVVDIWSAGCVLSEAAVWVLYGKEYLDQYRQKRKEETTTIIGFDDIECFHDGTDVLETVTEIHEYMLDDSNVSNSDYVTKEVLRMVKDMLERANVRPGAQLFCVKSKKILDKARESLYVNPDEGPFSSISLRARTPNSLVRSGSMTPPELPDEYGTFRARAGPQDKDRFSRSQTTDPIKEPNCFGLNAKLPFINGPSTPRSIDEDEDIDRQNDYEGAEGLPGPSRAQLSMKGKESILLSNPNIKRNITEPHNLVGRSRNQSHRAIDPANPATLRTPIKLSGVRNMPLGMSSKAQGTQPPLLHPPPPGSRNSSSSSLMSPENRESSQHSRPVIGGPQLAHEAPEDRSQSISLRSPGRELDSQAPPHLSVKDALTWKKQKKQLGWKNPQEHQLLGPLHNRDFVNGPSICCCLS